MTDAATGAHAGASPGPSPSTAGGRRPLIALAWVWVVVPFLYGVYSLLMRIPALFS